MNSDMKHLLLTGCLSLCFLTLSGQVLIPNPEKIQREEGELCLRNKTTIYAPDTTAAYLKIFRQDVLKAIPAQQLSKASKATIRFTADKSLSPEAYTLLITPKYLEVRAAGNAGFFYAVQTLKQWVKNDKDQLTFACVTINDRPRVGWRSFLLDSGRQYQKVSTIKKYIDMAAMLKMNYFHWHLTEGLGWRLEIKRYPSLTQRGAFVGKGPEQQGFYTQEEVKEIIRYAADRSIIVVPEIDMPGHSEAAIFSYPELGCFGDTIKIPKQGFTQNIFCAGKPSTVTFLKNVLDEVCSLFPSEYIHLGGDEAPKGNWNRCPNCQQVIKDKQLGNSHGLQRWFSSEMATYLKSKGKKAIFWGDVVYQDGPQLPDNVVIHWWNFIGHKDKALKEGIARNHPVVCGTNYYTYLNFPVTPWRGYAKGRTFDMKDIYQNNPSYIKEENPLILGMSCALWTDDGVTEEMIDRRLFPRIFVLAEQMWHRGDMEGFDTFYLKVQQKKTWFEKQGFRYGPALRDSTDTHYKWD